MMSIINPARLRTFLAVRKHLSYTRAAEEVFLSQPAVSRQIQQLERELGVSLFEQIGRSLHLTDSGMALAMEAEVLLARMGRVSEAVAAYQEPGAGTLRIGAGTTPGFFLLPPILGRFQGKYGGVLIDYRVESSREVEQSVLRNDVDLGFIGTCPSSEEIESEAMAEDEIICVASPMHGLAKRPRIDVGTLAGHTWVVRRRGSATRSLFESWLTENNGTVGRTIELGCPEAVQSLVAGGVGFSYMSELAVAEEMKSKKLKRLSVAGLRLRRTIYTIRHKDKRVSPTMGAFLDMMRSALRLQRDGTSRDPACHGEDVVIGQ